MTPVSQSKVLEQLAGAGSTFTHSS